MKKICLFLICVLPLSCNSDELNCKYKRSFVKELSPVDDNIQSSKWSSETDADSGENVAKLSIQYKNKDTAIVEHKFCDIYNFEYTYLFNNKPVALSKEDIAKQSAVAFNLSKIKPTLKTKIEQIVLKELTQQNFESNSPVTIGLPVEFVTYNDNVEYGIEYIPAEKAGAVASLIFYMSIGGE